MAGSFASKCSPTGPQLRFRLNYGLTRLRSLSASLRRIFLGGIQARKCRNRLRMDGIEL